jgi:hypothetical protein
MTVCVSSVLSVPAAMVNKRASLHVHDSSLAKCPSYSSTGYLDVVLLLAMAR